MRKYTTNINREFSRSYPESRRLERQCLSAISLVKSNNNLINNPLWILVINIVAIDMLKNRLQALPKSVDAVGSRVIIAGSEDPYSTIESQVGLIYPTPAASDDSNNSNKSNNSSQSSKGRRSVYNAGFLDDSPYVPKVISKEIFTYQLIELNCVHFKIWHDLQIFSKYIILILYKTSKAITKSLIVKTLLIPISIGIF